MQLKRNMENWLGNVWKFYSCDDNLAWLREFPQVSLNYFIVQSTYVLRRFPFFFFLFLQTMYIHWKRNGIIFSTIFVRHSFLECFSSLFLTGEKGMWNVVYSFVRSYVKNCPLLRTRVRPFIMSHNTKRMRRNRRQRNN